MTFQGVIFDCDGTLVDSETISLRVLVEFVAEFELVIPHSEAMECYAGGQLPHVFADIEFRLGRRLPEDFLDRFRERQLAALSESTEAIDGARELLESMQLALCVASNAPLSKVRLCLKTTGLLDLVPSHQIHSAYEIEKWKPEPDLFFKAAAAMEVEPANCAVVEDSGYGIEAGLRAGMKVFALDPRGTLPPQDPAVTVVSSLHDLHAIFV